MNINEAEYISLEKHPYLRLIIDGKEALIGDFKKSILDLGYVPLRSRDPAVAWETLLPTIYIAPTESQSELELQGFTNDPIILKMSHTYWNAINHIGEEKFTLGPISIPNI